MVALPTPARRAMSSRGASTPRSSKTSLAAASSSSALRCASARWRRRDRVDGSGSPLGGGMLLPCEVGCSPFIVPGNWGHPRLAESQEGAPMPAPADRARQPAIAGPAEVHSRLVQAYDQVLAGQLDAALALIDPSVIDHRGGLEGDHHAREAWRQRWERARQSGFTD